jgi:hypothetical protein
LIKESAATYCSIFTSSFRVLGKVWDWMTTIILNGSSGGGLEVNRAPMVGVCDEMK